ncbi:AAA family ATPase [soil metagenome]
MSLIEREHQLREIGARADLARAGSGGVLLVCGESGAGKTSFVETFLDRWSHQERVLWGACDPLSTPRPLGPIHDLSDEFGPTTQKLLRDTEQPYDIFSAVFEELRSQPTVLVVDDLHWADQGTVDLLRFVLRRIWRTSSLVVGTVRDDEIGASHAMRALLGDVARAAHGTSLSVPPLSLDAITDLVGGRPVDPAWLHRVTGGNAFFVCEMLDHSGGSSGDLPTTVRDAILARTAGLGVAEWDLLYLLACAPEAIPDGLLAHLGVTLPAMRALGEAKLIRRTSRGLAFRHDLCRLAVASVIPLGAESDLHRRMIDAYDAAARDDPAVVTHHALGARDDGRIVQAASDAGRAAARSGAHTQATDFYRIALDCGGPLPAASEAQLLELLADEYYLTDRLDDAIAACERAMELRQQLGDTVGVSANHHALSIYQWYNANRATAEDHVRQAVSALDDPAEPATPARLALLGHAFGTQANMAMHAADFHQAAALIARARDIADGADDPTLPVRLSLIEGCCKVYAGSVGERESVLAMVRSAPEHFDEIYSSAYSNMVYLDVEQRRLDQAADLFEVTIPLTVERDLPICRVWQVGSRGRLGLLTGQWDTAVVDAEDVLGGPSAPLARTWPLLVRSLVSLRRDGTGAEGIDEAWQLACRFGEPIRLLPAAAAIAEWIWFSGTADSRFEVCKQLLDSTPAEGLEWGRGELAMWLRRIDPSVDARGVAEPYRLLLDGDFEAAADEFGRLSTPYEAALALIDSGDPGLARGALDILDRLGAAAIAAKVRRDLRSTGLTAVPAKRRTTTLTNTAGLTSRQLDVLRLLGDGLTNAELAERLYLSIKTVDHHVSAVLAKLQVGTRRDAARRARELGILD